MEYRSRSIRERTVYTAWGNWSGWDTAYASASATKDVESRTEYSTRPIYHNTEYTSWGSWSDWSTTPVSSSATRDVNTKTEA